MASQRTPEGEVKTQICNYLSMLRRRGLVDFWLTHSTGVFDPKRNIMRTRNSPFDRLGQADISCVLKGGRALFIEVKSKTGTQSDNQKAFQNSVESFGALYILARSAIDVDKVLRPIFGF